MVTNCGTAQVIVNKVVLLDDTMLPICFTLKEQQFYLLSAENHTSLIHKFHGLKIVSFHNSVQIVEKGINISKD